MSAKKAVFPVVKGIRYNSPSGRANGQPQVTHVSLLQQFIDVEYKLWARNLGFGVRVKEDGWRDPVNAPVHLAKAGTADQTWHLYWEPWFGHNFAGAADLNVDPGSKERTFHLNVIRPRLELWGIGYHVEADHLHIDVGTFTSTVPGNGGWKRRALGAPNWAKTHVAPVTGKLDAGLIRALQHFLNTKRNEALAEDGDLGGFTARALQRWAGTKQDGDIGPITSAAIAQKLGTAQTWDSTWMNTLLAVRANSSNSGCPWGALPI